MKYPPFFCWLLYLSAKAGALIDRRTVSTAPGGVAGIDAPCFRWLCAVSAELLYTLAAYRYATVSHNQAALPPLRQRHTHIAPSPPPH